MIYHLHAFHFDTMPSHICAVLGCTKIPTEQEGAHQVDVNGNMSQHRQK